VIATASIAVSPSLYLNPGYDAVKDLAPLARLTNIPNVLIVHVPYKGVTQAMTAMMGGEVDKVVMPVTTAIPQIKAGKVRPFAVLTEKRIPQLPDMPTGIEAGVPGFTMPL